MSPAGSNRLNAELVPPNLCLMPYTSTKLWSELISRGLAPDDPIIFTSASLLNDAETLLTAAGTSPTDFTLHDAQHAFRVAELMTQVVGTEVMSQLSNVELCVLLLAAYLHDIGMVPHQGTANSIHDCILSGQIDLAPPEEREPLLEWADVTGVSIFEPIPDSSLDSFRLARQLAAAFCRYRHNDWSELWIRQHANLDSIYPGCADDLVLVCRSHHQGYAELHSAQFDPFRLPDGSVLNRRYLSCVLRVADILDVDPERTPSVVFKHREVSDSSEIFWKKDQSISLGIHQGTVHLSAEPTSAVMHKAVDSTADGIESELQLCYRLGAEKPFSHDANAPTVALPHSWHLQPYLHRRITPRNSAYEYIDGSFRPDESKILQLLGSRELYIGPLTAVRELLQNAFDSVLERQANAQLAQGKQTTDESSVSVTDTVVLEVEQSVDGVILRCTDTGAGMSKNIIRDYFLVSGASERPDLKALERSCRDNGVAFSRTGQFGIGVLSYFMLADRVSVETRRAPECSGTDGDSWCFRTDGVGTFGELRKADRRMPGTAINLRLKTSVADEAHAFAKELESYLEKTLVRIPCRFLLRIGDQTLWAANAGWVRQPSAISDLGFLWMKPEAKDDGLRRLPEHGNLTATVAHARRMRAFRSFADRDVSWNTSRDGTVEGVGECRIHAPSFSINGQTSPYLLFPDERSGELVIIDDQHGTSIGTTCLDLTFTSWKGMATHFRSANGMRSTVHEVLPNWEDVVIELDVKEKRAGRLSLSREFLDVDDDDSVHRIRDALASHICDFKRDTIRANATSLYGALWYTQLNRTPLPADVPVYWCTARPDQKSRRAPTVRWSQLQFPAIQYQDWIPHESAVFRGQAVSELLRLSVYTVGKWSGCGFPWSPSGIAIVVKNGIRVAMIPVWTEASDDKNFCETDSLQSYETAIAFDNCWNQCIRVGPPNGASIWNADFAPLSAGTKAARKWLREQSSSGYWLSDDKAVDIVAASIDRSDASAIAFIDLLRDPGRWKVLAEQHPQLSQALWSRWAGGYSSLFSVSHRIDKEALTVEVTEYSQGGISQNCHLSQIPDPGKYWTVYLRD